MSTQELDTAYQCRQRAKRVKLLRLADVNFEVGACVFVTMTFRENVKDYDAAVKGFKAFTKRPRRKLEDVRYIATLEIQKRGAFHFHVLINAPDVQFGLDNIVPLWQNGIVDIQAVDDVKKVLIYITKDLIHQNRSHCRYRDSVVSQKWKCSNRKKIKATWRIRIDLNYESFLSDETNSTIEEAMTRLKERSFPTGVNAIAFLLHKPVGPGSQAQVLKCDDPRVREFLDLGKLWQTFFLHSLVHYDIILKKCYAQISAFFRASRM